MRDGGRDPLVIALDSPHTREFATLYQGLADVEFAAKGMFVADTPETDEQDRCFSQRILAAHGLQGANPIPYVEVTGEELTWASDFLARKTQRDVKSLVAVAWAPGGARADLPDTHICNYRRWPTELRDRRIDALHSQGFLPIRFGTKGSQSHIYANHEEVAGVLSVPDLTLRQLAACYSIIGRYCGTDTGDHHLMLAAGGACDIWIPPSTWFYPHGRHLYGPTAPQREIYHVYQRAMPTQT